MGSDDLVTLKEVAALLGLNERAVRYHVRQGRLHPRYPKEQGLRAPMMFNRDEVAAAAETWDKRADFAGLMSRSVQAYALSRSLERRVEALEVLLGAKFNAAPIDEESVRSLYLEAKDDLKSPPSDPPRVGYWTCFFMSVGEEFFDVLESYTSNEKSWGVFHDLSRAIAEGAPLDMTHDLDFQEAYRNFERARRNLRQVLFFHLQSRYGTKDAVKMFEEDVGSHEQILRFLGATANPG